MFNFEKLCLVASRGVIPLVGTASEALGPGPVPLIDRILDDMVGIIEDLLIVRALHQTIS